MTFIENSLIDLQYIIVKKSLRKQLTRKDENLTLLFVYTTQRTDDIYWEYVGVIDFE